MAYRVLRALCFIALIGCIDIAAAGAQNNEALGAVTGHVICGDTQRPARLAHVLLEPIADVQSPLNTSPGYHREGIFHLQPVNLDGSFSIPAVPPGVYYVIAEQDGYISPLAVFTRDQLAHPDEATLRRISRYMTSISVTAGHTTQTEVDLVRGAVVAGTVRFEDGSPAVNVNVGLLQRDAKDEWKPVRTEHLASHGSSYTDDQGVFRFSGLPAGEYLVRASIELNKVIKDHIFTSSGGTSYGDGYRLRIFPDDTFRPRDAKPLKVQEGENLTNIDVDVPLSKLLSVNGIVMRPDSASPANAAHLTLNFADGGEEVASTDVDADDGSFRFDFVPAANYVLHASKIATVERTEVSNGQNAVPPTHTETKTIASYGDVSVPVELTSDQSSVILQATAVKKP